MLDDIQDINEYYGSNTESEHTRLERHQLEYDLTCRYTDRYLPEHGTILEIGAATGRYTVALARRGYRLTAVDLSAANIGLCQHNLVDAGLEGQVQLVVADARDLSAVKDTQFDAVLLMGPLYHLVMEADRKLALQQAVERLRVNGILFSAFLSRFGLMGYLINSNPGWITDQTEVRSILEKGRRPDQYPRGGFRGYFAKALEIPPLHEALGIETLVVAGVEPAISADDECYNNLQGKERQLWLDLLFELSTEPSIIGASRHLLYIGKKIK